MRDCFSVLEKDLKPFPKRERLVSIIGEDCLFLLGNFFFAISKRLHGARGYFDWGDIATMSVTNTEDTSQETKGILELFKGVSNRSQLFFSV